MPIGETGTDDLIPKLFTQCSEPTTAWSWWTTNNWSAARKVTGVLFTFILQIRRIYEKLTSKTGGSVSSNCLGIT